MVLYVGMVLEGHVEDKLEERSPNCCVEKKTAVQLCCCQKAPPPPKAFYISVEWNRMNETKRKTGCWGGGGGLG